MTKELNDALNREYDKAEESGDIKRILCSIGNMCKANNECQMKTSARVKRLQVMVFSILTGGGITGVSFVKWHKLIEIFFN